MKKPTQKQKLKREGPLSLHPLTPEQALSAFMKTPVKAQKKVAKKKKRK